MLPGRNCWSNSRSLTSLLYHPQPNDLLLLIHQKLTTAEASNSLRPVTNAPEPPCGASISFSYCLSCCLHPPCSLPASLLLLQLVLMLHVLWCASSFTNQMKSTPPEMTLHMQPNNSLSFVLVHENASVHCISIALIQGYIYRLHIIAVI